MFYKKETKYTRIYFSIINNAQKLNRNRSQGYYENHHIQPKSLGGDNNKTNLVLLTAREHFICHFALYKHFKAILCKNGIEKMGLAFWGMARKQNGQTIAGGRSYEIAKKIWHKSMISVDRSDPVYRKKISDTLKGIKRSEETRARMSNAQSKNNDFRTQEWKDKLSDFFQGCFSNKFKVLYHTPYGVFASSRAAEKEIGINRYTVYARCVKNTTITKRTLRDSKDYSCDKDSNMIGKRWRDVGWFFEECDKYMLTAQEKEEIMAKRGENDTVFTSSKAFKVTFTSGKSTVMLDPNGISMDEAYKFVGLKFGFDVLVSVEPL